MIDPQLIYKMAVKQMGQHEADLAVKKALAVNADPDTVLMAQMNGTEIRDVAIKRGWYEGHSTNPGEGGRFKVLTDQVMFDTGADYQTAKEVAVQAGIKRYGADQMNSWARSGGQGGQPMFFNPSDAAQSAKAGKAAKAGQADIHAKAAFKAKAGAAGAEHIDDAGSAKAAKAAQAAKAGKAAGAKKLAFTQDGGVDRGGK